MISLNPIRSAWEQSPSSVLLTCTASSFSDPYLLCLANVHLGCRKLWGQTGQKSENPGLLGILSTWSKGRASCSNKPLFVIGEGIERMDGWIDDTKVWILVKGKMEKRKNEIDTQRMAVIKKKKGRKEILVRTWRNWKLCALWWEREMAQLLLKTVWQFFKK